MQKCKIARQKCKIDTSCDVSYQFERRVKRRNSTFRKKNAPFKTQLAVKSFRKCLKALLNDNLSN